jgi:tetratricopeptide (TPR) repeat protein
MPLKACNRLSVVAICKNEIHNLIPFLKSAGLVADEFVIADTGSTDGTLEMLHRLDFKEKGRGSLKLRRFEWCQDFAAARNFALSHATGDWVLYLDLDDRLERNAPDIIEALKNGPRKDLAFAFEVASLSGEDGVYVRSMQIRMFPRLPGIRWERPVHEIIQPSLAAAGIGIEPVPPCKILHLGYEDRRMQSMKAKRNSEILEKMEPKDFLCFHELGDAYMQLGAFDLAAINFRRARDLSAFEEQTRRVSERIICALMFMGARVEAQKEVCRLPDTCPEHLFWQGEIFYLEKRYNEAAPLYADLLDCPADLTFMASYLDAYKSTAERRLKEMEVKYAEKGSAGGEA